MPSHQDRVRSNYDTPASTDAPVKPIARVEFRDGREMPLRAPCLHLRRHDTGVGGIMACYDCGDITLNGWT